MRNVKTTLRHHAAAQIKTASDACQNLPPHRGWLERFRTALGMSITDLSQRVGVSRPSLSRLEQREKDGAITMKQLEKVAEAMGGKLVYAIVPAESGIEDLIMAQARRKARRIITRTRAQMALEDQSDGLDPVQSAIEDLAQDLARNMARDFWK